MLSLAWTNCVLSFLRIVLNVWIVKPDYFLSLFFIFAELQPYDEGTPELTAQFYRKLSKADTDKAGISFMS